MNILFIPIDSRCIECYTLSMQMDKLSDGVDMGEGRNGTVVSKRDAEGVSALIRPDTNRQLELLAQMMQTSKSSVIRWAIEEYLAKRLSPNR